MDRFTLFIADIHGNLLALEKVLEDYQGRGFPLESSTVVCLGDVVGYGARPSACVERLQSLDAITVMGNHDAAVVGEVSVEWFNPMARSAVRWTREQVKSAHVDWLASLPRQLDHGAFDCVHGSPSDPFSEYITGPLEATRAVDESHQSAVMSGHTHIPALYRSRSTDGSSRLTDETLNPGEHVPVDPSQQRLAVNPGSVGQPRDGDPRAAYLVWDRDQYEMIWYRTSYPIEETQREIREAGLPDRLASRLAVGS